MPQSENIAELAKALASVQAQLQPAIKDSLNPHLKNKYADLTSVIDAIQPLLGKAGIALIQSEIFVNDTPCLETMLAHESGQWKSGHQVLHVEAGKGINLNQAHGAALSYARRYGASAMVGITAEDDDGHSASPAKKAKQPTVRDTPPKQDSEPTERSTDQKDADFRSRLEELQIELASYNPDRWALVIQSDTYRPIETILESCSVANPQHARLMAKLIQDMEQEVATERVVHNSK